jgi:hypothetical protein
MQLKGAAAAIHKIKFIFSVEIFIWLRLQLKVCFFIVAMGTPFNGQTKVLN